MSGPLAGRLALVTGASRGIGASVAAHMAKQGARLVLAGRDAAALSRVALAVNELGSEALTVACDLRQAEERARLFAAARELGPLEILVNNAAALHAGPLVELAPERWQEMLELNLGAVLACCQAGLREMLPRRRGVIVNVASVSGVPGVEKLPGLVAYAATKGGVLALSEALAAEVAPAGVRVVAVSPGAVQTDMLRSVAPDAVPGAMTPGQVGRVIAWLAGDDAAAVNQTNVVVWGPPATSGEGEGAGGAP
ncbi:MAG: SDR family NAD(P)-dependent oxidoreductase [Planctomycetota bacterium]